MKMNPVSEGRRDESNGDLGTYLRITDRMPAWTRARFLQFPLLWVIIAFRLVVAGLSVLSLAFVLYVWRDPTAEQDLGSSLVFSAGLYAVLFLGLPSVVIAIGLLKHRLWAVRMAIVHDVTLVLLALVFFFPLLVLFFPLLVVGPWFSAEGAYLLWRTHCWHDAARQANSQL
ncbi:MAG TPA: hypothetical protein VMX94_03690 [Armatimonadota bacterium]|nr:hypothetical protein [Armatimonadota bacterium]